MLGGTTAVAIIVVAAAVVIAGRGGSALKTGTRATATVKDVQHLLTGIPQSGTRLGKVNAKVTLTDWSDLQCPACGAFTRSETFSRLLSSYVRSGKVRIDYRSVETATQDSPTFSTQQIAAYAAGEQGLFWTYVELFYRQQASENSGYVTNSFLTGLAKQVPGLNLTAWRAARNDPALVDRVKADTRTARAQRVSSTPTLILRGPKGSLTMPPEIPTFQQLEQAYNNVS